MSDVAPGAAPSPSSARMLTALVRLRDALQRTTLPLELPGVDERRVARVEMIDQLEDYVLPRLVQIDAPLLTVVGGSTGAGKSTLVNSLVGTRVSDARRAPADDAVTGARAQPGRRGLVRPGPDPPRPRTHRERDDRPRRPPARGHDLAAARTGRARRARHRLRRGAQPGAGGPAAGRGRPVAVRDHGGAVRRPGALGLPQAGRRPQCSGRDRARPHRPRPPWPRSAATWPAC